MPWQPVQQKTRSTSAVALPHRLPLREGRQAVVTARDMDAEPPQDEEQARAPPPAAPPARWRSPRARGRERADDRAGQEQRRARCPRPKASARSSPGTGPPVAGRAEEDGPGDAAGEEAEHQAERVERARRRRASSGRDRRQHPARAAAPRAGSAHGDAGRAQPQRHHERAGQHRHHVRPARPAARPR